MVTGSVTSVRVSSVRIMMLLVYVGSGCVRKRVESGVRMSNDGIVSAGKASARLGDSLLRTEDAEATGVWPCVMLARATASRRARQL